MFPKGTAHSFLLVSDGDIDNRDGGNLMTEVKAESGRGGGCITVVADPLHLFCWSKDNFNFDNFIVLQE